MSLQIWPSQAVWDTVWLAPKIRLLHADRGTGKMCQKQSLPIVLGSGPSRSQHVIDNDNRVCRIYSSMALRVHYVHFSNLCFVRVKHVMSVFTKALLAITLCILTAFVSAIPRAALADASSSEPFVWVLRVLDNEDVIVGFVAHTDELIAHWAYRARKGGKLYRRIMDRHPALKAENPMYANLDTEFFTSDRMLEWSQEEENCFEERSDTALEACNQIIKAYERFAQPVSQQYLSRVYTNRCYHFADMWKLGRALSDCSEAVRLAPQFDRAYRAKGHVYQLLGNYALSMSYLGKAIQRGTSDALNHNARAWALYKFGRYRLALVDVERALQLSPKYAAALDTRGHVLEALGATKRAEADFRKALDINPYLEESNRALKRLGVTK